MKIFVFSDIHGNLKALNAVLEQIKEKVPDLTVFLGDILQRGNEETECLDLLKNNDIICLKGNCELYLQHGVDIDPDVEHLRSYYDEIRKKVTVEQMQFIKQMPLVYEAECCGHKMRFSHFLFLDTDSAYPFLPLSSLNNGVFDEACRRNDIMKYDLLAVGHSHRNFVNENVVSVSASGLEGASYLLIEANESGISFEHIDLKY
ncbi:MAG: metallophosphoesterase [Ruminococcus sp.]|uniref:metallophosphoesterase family protein n=1 Tax=Ruminococcus sp. TaxID=41978 RepID=UPI0025EE1119|nr:metallophosphoesterase [Ruminococcus sp.]MCR5600593.1 metallophosphoesterase [Ruminococcus sp.]